MKEISLLLLLAIALFSCSKDNADVEIRLANVSEFDFQNIVVNTSTGEVNFEDIKSGKKSAYQVFEKAYRYAYIELEIAGKRYSLQPIDYVGETPLSNGFYTYQIDAEDTQDQYGSLSLTLIED